jgi:uncharacterized membrane protein
MSFASPYTLLLLIPILAFVWYIGWPRYPFRRRRDLSSLFLRTIILVMIVLALAGFQIIQQVDRLAVVFLVDASDSVGTELREAQEQYIRDAVTTKPPDDEWSIIVFGADISIDMPFVNLSEVPPIYSTVLGSNTDIAQAIQTAMSLFPADARRRIVVLSDGIQTIGNAEAKAQLAEASGVEISYVLFAREASPDIRIAEFTSPARVNEGQEFDINITIEADEASDATLLIYARNELIREEVVNLRTGRNSYTLTQHSGQTGFLNFSAQLIVAGASDAFTQNNRLGTFSEVIGQPRVLILSGNQQEISNLVSALTTAGLQVDTLVPINLPSDASALTVYESVIIANVPASELTTRQMELLQVYVRDLSGGLVFVGGPDSYAPGGYFQTPVEAVLPVETQIRDQQRLPRLTIAYLIDSSGSMAVSSDGIFTNLEIAKQAVNLSIEFLQPTDRAAVLTFESSGTLVAPFQDVNDRLLLQQQVNSLGTGGGTDILAGLLTAERYIVDEESEIKHLVLMTDGGASPRDLIETTERLKNVHGVTLSVIAIGNSVPTFLEEMTVVGGGNYHEAINVAQIPVILAQETVLATRSYIEEGDFAVRASANNPILDGISQPPNLNGYVATHERSTAQVILRAPEPYDDPILATWQYGLGRSVAFTSDATGRWATNWISWADFSRFWGQVINYSISDNAGNLIETQVNFTDQHAQILVDAREEGGAFLNNLALQVSILGPDNKTEVVSLQQTAPGRYEATFEPKSEGSYFLVVNGSGVLKGETQQFNEVTGWVMSYSPEYAQNEPNEGLLIDLADLTGGGNLAQDPATAFGITQQPRTAPVATWPWLLLAILIIFPIDIAIRRVIVTRRDLQRLRLWIQGSEPEQESEERMSSLMAARERARAKTFAGESDESTISALSRRRQRARSSEPQVQAELPSDEPERPQPQPFAPAPERPRVGGESTVGGLLKRRKGQDREDEG